MNRDRAELSQLKGTEGPPGVVRTTLSYEPQSMFCHFRLSRGARVPLHSHPAVQQGYVIRGRVHFLAAKGPGFEAAAGSSYVFHSGEQHGAEALEETELIESFTPMRPEYADN